VICTLPCLVSTRKLSSFHALLSAVITGHDVIVGCRDIALSRSFTYKLYIAFLGTDYLNITADVQAY